MPYLGRAPTGTGSVTEIDGDLKITGQLTAQDTLFKQILDGTDGSSTNAGDNIIIEDGGTDGSGTNAGDDICLEKATEGVSDISSIASTILSPANTGSIKEVVSLVCDGRSVTVGSGTYTAQDVTAVQLPTASYADFSGSLLAYTPPSGAQAVIYDFHWGYGYSDNQHMHHLNFYIDSDEVTSARRGAAGYGYHDHLADFRWVITIGDGNETATGKLASWSSSKTLKLQVRAYSTSHQAKLHETTYWDGTGGSILMVPTLTITAIG